MHGKAQYNTVRYTKYLQYRTVRYGTVKIYSTVRYATIRYDTLRNGAVLYCGAEQYGMVPVRCGAIREYSITVRW